MSANGMHGVVAEQDSPAYSGWRVTLASSAGVLFSFASILVFTFSIFLKPLSEAFHWSRESVSLSFAIAAVTVAAASPPIGWLLDRFGPRRVILPCLAIFGAAVASLALLTPHLWHLYLVFFVLGAVGNGTAQLAHSRAVSTWFERERGRAFAVLMTGSAAGAALWPPIAQSLIQWFGWRGAYAILGGLILVIGLPVVAVFVRERPGFRAASGRITATGATPGEAFRSRAFWILVVVLFLASIGQNAIITHLSALLTDRGISGAGAAFAVSALGIAAVLGRLAAGWLLDRFFAPHVSFWLLAISAAGVFLLASAHSVLVGSLAAMMIGSGMGGEADVTPYLLSRYFGLRSFATLYGFTWTAYAIAGAAGPVLMGRVVDATASYVAVVVKLSVLMAAASGLMLLMPRYDMPDAEPSDGLLPAACPAVNQAGEF